MAWHRRPPAAVPEGLAKHTVFLYSTRHSASGLRKGRARGRAGRQRVQIPPISIGKVL